MSDNNEPKNPYHPPLLSDKPLSQPGIASPNTNLHPVHLLFPLAGYAYVPSVIMVAYLLGSLGLDDKYAPVYFWGSFFLLFPALPLYAGVLLLLDRARKKWGKNSCALVFYHGLSLLLPVLWLVYCGWKASGGRFS